MADVNTNPTGPVGETYKCAELSIPNEHFVENIYPVITITLDSDVNEWGNFIIGTQSNVVAGNNNYKTGYKVLCSGISNIATLGSEEVQGKLVINTKYSIAKIIYNGSVQTQEVVVTLEPIDGVTSFALNKKYPILYMEDVSSSTITADNATMINDTSVKITYTPMVRLGAL